jgi:hypothetical protein
MNRIRIALVSAVFLLAVVFTPGCYEGTVVDLRSDLEITGDVSFSADVIPIFENSCSISGCHNTGGIAPDLSTANAYNSLSNGGYLDINNPEASSLYGYVSGALTPAMPIGGADPVIAATVLAWIQQGAQNN